MGSNCNSVCGARSFCDTQSGLEAFYRCTLTQSLHLALRALPRSSSDNLINSQDGYFLKHSRMECFDATLTLNTRILLVSVISRRKTIHRIVFLGPSTSFARSVGEQLNADKVCGRSNPTRKTKKNTPDWVCSFLAPPAGLEPATT